MLLVVFAVDEVLTGLDLTGVVPAGAPVDALDVRLHRHSENPEWVDGFRSGPLRDLAARELPDLRLIDDATCCYSVQVRMPDPADLTHLQLAWAVAAAACRAGATAVLDVFAHDWSLASSIAGLDPNRPFTVLREISVVAESDESPGFGHAVHTRGMLKFGRPDLIMGVPRDEIGEAAQILNQLAGMLAEGHVLEPGRQLRIDGERTLTVVPYLPDTRIPDVKLIGDGLLLEP
ncbi:hypothetical protein Q0Z83_067430 [Actinoplanes sichuanensis]|uniref:DUF4261 domain-containing protein n=1 Tax=Actinoplanes sichuanensis TaxID=512349 RepID=A0ABW4AV92_9ACTN|nr:hypothetical protein [Actinoplanes sichuanensis]BEL08552.1 hypothetical protein Q0Z83_067430 [Actinoplanes sichuanensis]